jgi:hypothetical protein
MASQKDREGNGPFYFIPGINFAKILEKSWGETNSRGTKKMEKEGVPLIVIGHKRIATEEGKNTFTCANANFVTHFNGGEIRINWAKGQKWKWKWKVHSFFLSLFFRPIGANGRGAIVV